MLDGLDGRRDFDRAALAKVLARKLRGLWPERAIGRLEVIEDEEIRETTRRAFVDPDELGAAMILTVRRVRFDPQTVAELRRWKADQASERLVFGAAYKTHGGVGVELPWLITEPGAVVHPNTLLRRWKAIVKAAGVTPVTLHGGRHSYAELALGAGVRLHVVSRQLGHRSISTTADIYTHDNDSATAEVLGGIRRPSVLPLAAARDERCWAGSVGGGI